MRFHASLDRYRPLVGWLALGLVFFGSLALAAHFFPPGYDWRRDVMSRLAEPRFNPRAYLVACAGLAVSGLLLLPFPALLRRRLAACAPGTTRWSGRLLYGAAAFLTLAGIIPGHVPGLGGAHETLVAHLWRGIGAGDGRLFLGGALAAGAVSDGAGSGACSSSSSHWPVSSSAACRSCSGRMSSRPATDVRLRMSVWNSLALWEWIAGVGTYLFLGLLLTLPESEKDAN